MKIVSLLVIFFSIVCFTDVSFAKPDWIDNPDIECSENEICAVGTGITGNISRSDARNNILRYFETNINSRFSSSLSTNEITEKSFKMEDLEEETSGILKGVKIKKTYKSNNEYYALAILKKDFAIKEIKSDILKIDEKMKLLIQEENVKYNKELEKLYLKRDIFNKKYLILTGDMIPEAIDYKSIFNIKKKTRNLSLKYYILRSTNYAQELNYYLASVLMENGVKVIGSSSSADRILILTVKKSDMYLNVEGFVKKSYILEIQTRNSSNKVITNLYKEFVEVGRSDEKVKEAVSIKIKNFINENIDQLLQ